MKNIQTHIIYDTRHDAVISHPRVPVGVVGEKALLLLLEQRQKRFDIQGQICAVSARDALGIAAVKIHHIRQISDFFCTVIGFCIENGVLCFFLTDREQKMIK